MSQKFQAPRGTNDIIPAPFQKDPIFEIHRWQFVEAQFLLNAWNYGYQEVRTPMFEDIELFIRSSGEASEVVNKEMYDFYDKGERHIALKPEGTAPVMRAFLEHGMGNLGTPNRLCYINHSFRYGRPGKGRYRQLHQLGMEIVGSASPFADAEIITATHDFFSRVGIDSARVMINCIGDFSARSKFSEAILAHISSYLADKDAEARAKLERNPVRLLDTKEPALRAALQGLAPITDFINYESKANFDQVQAELTDCEIPFTIDPMIVRGLDYYNDTVFEFIDDDLEGLSLCGGGRYDALIEQIGGKPTPAAGVGIGLERLLLTLEQKQLKLEAPQIDTFIVAATEGARSQVRQLAAELRANDISCVIDIDDRNIKQQFKSADRANAIYSLILGDDELLKNTVTIKNMATQEQESIKRSELLDWLSSSLLQDEDDE
ncbi:histidine--tRNA ligase [Armatimonadetes bacterium Uphvl-Ar1]|nr:histidine--tRNA ligase [Armatimonadetes bacterium Uphvl-Ar1]